MSIALFCGLTVGEVSDISVAVGTLVLALVAIYGEAIRAKLFPPKIALQLRSDLGDSTQVTIGGSGAPLPAMFFHVRVINLRRSIPITNCRVSIREIHKRMPDGSFKPIPMAIPLELKWAPAEANEQFVTITSDRILDLGHVIQALGVFRPAVRILPNNFKGLVAADEAIRYGLWVDATNYCSSEPTFFEVSWDGKFSTDPTTFSQHFVIKKV